VALPLLLVLAVIGYFAAPRANGQTSLTAVATLGIFADFARQVGGDRVAVVQLVGDGVDVHDYQMTPGDLVALNRAQVLLYNSLGLEPFLGQLLTAGGRPGLTRVALAEGLTPITTGGSPNPHFWLNPQFAVRYVERIRDAFSAADPAGADLYQANAARYIAELGALDAELESAFGLIPAASRKLITLHDAFPYFAQRYGFELIGAVLSAEGREPSPAELIALIRQVRQAGVRAIFTEPQFNARFLDQIARDTDIRVFPLYSDTYPPDGSFRSYLDLMRANARNVLAGLG
jgi:ABC-type Zn uptake system ZnuABC Zn-binding protein ZnuA